MDDDMIGNKPGRGTWARTFRDWRTVILVGSFVAVLVFFLFHLVSDGDFSFLMTLSNLLRVSALGLLLVKAFGDHSGVTEISLKSMQCYCAVSALRLSSILFYEGYLPFDSSGDWFYQSMEVFSLILAGSLIFTMTMSNKRHGYNPRNDVFGNDFPLNLPSNLGALWLIVPSIVVAMLFHPTLNNNFVTDAAWSAALYLEAVAILPQDRMFRRGSRLHELTSLSVFMIGMSGLLSLIFWLFSFSELNASYSSHFGHSYPGYVVVGCQFLNLVIMFDFIRRYVQAATSGRPPILPS